MRLGPIEDIGDGLAFVRSKGGDVNQRLHLLMARSRDHGPGVGVTRKNDRPRSSLQRALNGRRIFGLTTSGAAEPRAPWRLRPPAAR